MSARVVALLLGVLGIGGLAHAQTLPSFLCALDAGTPPVLRSGVRTELIADLVLTCTGGVPTAAGQTAPAATINVFLNANITSRILGGENWSEALLLLDDPAPGLQFPCTTANGVCSAFGNGTGSNYYGAGTQTPTSPNNRNVFQGQIVSATQIRFTGVPLDRPGPGRTRRLRITNIRVDTNANVGSTIPSTIQAFVTNTAEVPISNPQVTVGFVQDALTPAVLNASSVAAPNGVPVPLAPAADTVRFGALRFAETSAASAKTRTAAGFVNTSTSPAPADQNFPGTLYNTETGFFVREFPTITGRGNLARAGLADSGTRLAAVISNIPDGVNIFVDTVNTTAAAGPTARLIASGENGAGDFSPVPGVRAQLPVVRGTATAIWEVLRANSALAENFDFGIYLSYAANFAPVPPSPVLVRMGLVPVSAVGSASATAPIPRTFISPGPLTLFTFVTAASLTATPQSLAFTASAGGTPQPQAVLIGSTAGQVGFTVATSGQIPLSVQPSTGVTPFNLLVAPASQGLSQGVYEGSITVASPSAVSVVIPVVLRVTPGPALTSINPNTAVSGSQTITLTVTGRDFVAGAVVRWNSVTLATTFQSANQLVAQVPASLLRSPGSAAISVALPDGSTSTALPFTVTEFSITSIEPASVRAGSPAFTLTINGSGFETGATVQAGSNNLSPLSVTPTRITVTIPATLVVQPGTLPVAVRNPAGLVSNSISINVVAGPVISSLSPDTVSAGGSGFTLTINGAGFATGATAQLGGVTVQPTSVTETRVVVAVQANLVAQTGALPVTVTNPNRGVSNTVNLTVAAGPVIASIAPSAVVAGGPAFNLTIAGRNFLPGAVVQLGGNTLGTSSLTPTQITAAVPAGAIAEAGAFDVTVTNPGNAVSNSVALSVSPRPVITSLSATTFTLGGGDTALVIVGSGFEEGSEVAVAIGSAAPVILTPSSVTPAQIDVTLPASLLAAGGQGSVVVANPGGIESNAVAITIGLPPLPQPSFTGPGTSPSGQDQAITVGLAAEYPIAVQGRLTLTFTPEEGLPNDPAIQFQNGSRIFDFNLPTGPPARPQVMVKTGTVAGVITITPAFTAAGVDVTPPGVAVQRIQIARSAPVLSFVDCVRTSNSTFNVIIDGHTNTREATDAAFTFQAAAGANLGTGQLTVPAGSLFSSWFGGASSANAGGTFRYTQTFNVQGSAADVGSISVRLSNSVGASAAQGAASCRVQ